MGMMHTNTTSQAKVNRDGGHGLTIRLDKRGLSTACLDGSFDRGALVVASAREHNLTSLCRKMDGGVRTQPRRPARH